MEAISILAILIQRFHLELVPNQSKEVDPRFSVRPKYGVKVRIQKKQ